MVFGHVQHYFPPFANRLLTGLEEFEEKIEALEKKTEKGEEEGGWLTTIVREFAKVKQEVEQELDQGQEENIDVEQEDLEPPLLDPTWGLGYGTNSNRGKRELLDDHDEKMENTHKDGSDADQCRKKVWRCMSGVLERGVKYVENPLGLLG